MKNNDNFLNFYCALCVHRKYGYMYQYLKVYYQDLQGHLDIKKSNKSNHVIVIGGKCYDIFIFKEVRNVCLPYCSSFVTQS